MPHRYEMPIASFIAIVLVILPLPWHWKARNVATLSLIACLVVGNLMRGINSIIWMDNVVIHYRVWCDISSKVLIGLTVALPACSFCLTRHLEHVASSRCAVSTSRDKRRRRLVDLSIIIGIPVLVMSLHYIVQGHRFDIIEDIGCQPNIYISVLGIIICFVPPLMLSLGSLIFAGMALHHFAQRRLEFEQHLRNSQSSLNTARYMRLMALAITEMCWGQSLGCYIIYLNVRENGVRPYTSWADVHYNFSRIALYPAWVVPRWTMDRLLLSWWILPITAVLFFLFFGFSEEALEGYASTFRWTRRRIFRQKLSSSTKGSYSKGDSLPQFRTPRPLGVSASRPEDIHLQFPDTKFDDVDLAPLPPYAPRKDDFGSPSALSLTLPELGDDIPSPSTPSPSHRPRGHRVSLDSLDSRERDDADRTHVVGVSQHLDA